MTTALLIYGGYTGAHRATERASRRFTDWYSGAHKRVISGRVYAWQIKRHVQNAVLEVAAVAMILTTVSVITQAVCTSDDESKPQTSDESESAQDSALPAATPAPKTTNSSTTPTGKTTTPDEPEYYIVAQIGILGRRPFVVSSHVFEDLGIAREVQSVNLPYDPKVYRLVEVPPDA